MNRVCLIGNLTKDPEKKSTNGGVDICNFTIAVQRSFKNKDGSYDADFINCVAFRQTATYLGNYIRKGNRVSVDGSIQTRTYDGSDGQKHYVTEIIADRIENLTPRSNAAEQPHTQGEFQEVQMDGLPF